jgi:hypothetical protein
MDGDTDIPVLGRHGIHDPDQATVGKARALVRAFLAISTARRIAPIGCEVFARIRCPGCIHGPAIGPQRCCRQAGAETFQHHVAGEEPEGGACDCQRHGNRGGADAKGTILRAILERPPCDQSYRGNGKSPADQARDGPEAVIDPADENGKYKRGANDRSRHSRACAWPLPATTAI